jgi:predicted ABC-type ATPase
MSETQTLPIEQALEITQEIPEIFANLLELYEEGVEFVELGVEGDQIVIREVEKSNPTVSSVHVPSTEWNKDDLILSKAMDDEKRYTLAPWYVPDVLDAHGEWTDKDEVQRAFWDYLKRDDRSIRLQHNMDIVAGEWVEGLTWPHEVSVPVKHPEGDREITFPAGTPFLGVVWEPWAWELIKSGEIRGLSIGGRGKRLEADIETYDYDPMGKVSFTKMIRTVNGKYVVYSEDGSRSFGTYDTEDEAKERLRQIEYFSKGNATEDELVALAQLIVERLEKHLPGQHDQLFHGRGGYAAVAERRREQMGNVPDLRRDADGRIANESATGGYLAGIPESVTMAGFEHPLTPRDSAWHHLESDGQGGYQFTKERAQMHEQIIKDAVSGVPSSDEPVFTMLGGGPAAGKSTFVRETGMIADRTQAVHVNADEFKEGLPEYNLMRNAYSDNDFFNAAGFSHEESSYLSELARKNALANSKSVVLDGTGNGNYEKFAGKINEAKSRGYTVEGNYVTVPTDVAVTRSFNRSLKQSERRFVPQNIVEGTHGAVSRTFPRAVDDGLFDRFSLWDTSSSGGPKIILEGTGRSATIIDQGAYSAFLEKGNPTA